MRPPPRFAILPTHDENAGGRRGAHASVREDVPALPPRGLLRPPADRLRCHTLVPRPTTFEPGTGDGFVVTPTTAIPVPAGNEQMMRIGRFLADWIGIAAGPTPPRVEVGCRRHRDAIVLQLGQTADPAAEAYELTVSSERLATTAARPGRPLLRHPDAEAAAASLRRARGDPRRCLAARACPCRARGRQPPIRMAWRDARRRASLLQRRRRQALHGSDGTLQAIRCISTSPTTRAGASRSSHGRTWPSKVARARSAAGPAASTRSRTIATW